MNLCSAAFAVVLHIGSFHTEPGFDNSNYGVGLQCRLNQSWSLETGVYNNSHSRTSAYIGGEYRYTFSNEWAIGFAGGIASNYPRGSEFAGLIPIAGITAHTPQWNGFGASAIFGPKVYKDGSHVFHFMITKEL